MKLLACRVEKFVNLSAAVIENVREEIVISGSAVTVLYFIVFSNLLPSIA